MSNADMRDKIADWSRHGCRRRDRADPYRYRGMVCDLHRREEAAPNPPAS